MRSISVALGLLFAIAACTGGSDPPTGGSSGASSSGITSSSSGGSSSGGSSSGGSSSGGSSGGAGTPLEQSSYATDCTSAEDCVAVYFGSNACCGGCANGAIAATDKTRYDADNAAFQASCGDRGVGCPDVECVQVVPGCSAGHCTIGR